MVLERFGDAMAFKQRVNPDTQLNFGKNQKAAIMGDYPTLNDICAAYGKNFSAEWIVPHLVSLTLHTGAKNLTKEQLRELAKIISIEYRHLKVTEILLFFYKFKTGRYGRFYGSVDPMVITCALREFISERNTLIDRFEREQKQEDDTNLKLQAMSREEWLEYKQQQEKQEV